MNEVGAVGRGLPTEGKMRLGSQEEASAAERDDRETIGRSRCGYGTKACVIADGAGRALAFRIAPGQAHEVPYPVPLFDRLPGMPLWVVNDCGYSSHRFRQYILDMAASLPSHTGAPKSPPLARTGFTTTATSSNVSGRA